MSDYFFSLDNTLKALLATLFTWAVTAMGALLVYFFKNINKTLCNILLSISSGIMCAASFWSLLSPARDMANKLNLIPHWVLCIGFLSGGLFLILSDKIIRTDDKQSFMLIFSITLHNIPEGLAIGIAFAGSQSHADIIAACVLTFGIALQNFPEGAAVSLPLKGWGYSTNRAFFYGQISGFAEPISALLGSYAVSKIETLLPFALSFAAGSMIYVVITELLPESIKGENKTLMSLCFMLGFCVMTALDVGLG